MKRLHVHVGVEDLDRSIDFYSTLFGAEPTVTKGDYAKWMLEDPRVNFAISTGQHAEKGIEHLGIQVESSDQLAEVYGRLKRPTGRCSRRRNHLLLRQIREELDRRSGRNPLGGLPHQRRGHRLRRQPHPQRPLRRRLRYDLLLPGHARGQSGVRRLLRLRR